MRCKICNQERDGLYTLLNFGVCVHCKLYLERKLNPKPLSPGYARYAAKSEKACDKYLKEIHKND